MTTQAHTPAQVLIVDDEPALRTTLQLAIGDLYQVTTCGSVKEALARFDRGERFAVILCDLMLDPLSGIDLHEALVKRVPDQAARMIFMTGGAFTRQAQRFLEEVPNPHLQKPFDFDRLLALIDEIASS
ncbi:MAG: response regulator [Myxococcales bacterium]|nr:response regulator [Myxococcales bacterium]